MLITAIPVAMLTALSDVVQTDNAALTDVYFMQGHWRTAGEGMIFEELWLPPMGPVMSGHMRMGRPDQAPSLFELLSITETDDGLTLRISHFDAEHTPWEIEAKEGPVLLIAEARGGSDEVVFLDGTGQGRVDSITYRLTGDGELQCSIQFPDAPDGQPLVIEFERVR